MIQLTLTLKMTTAQVIDTSVTVNNNNPIQDYVHPDDQTQPTFEMTLGCQNDSSQKDYPWPFICENTVMLEPVQAFSLRALYTP